MTQQMRYKEYPLSNEIKRALSEMGFQYPLPVQEEALPRILAGEDLTVRSRTGSGKTAAFAIPICEKIDPEKDDLQAVVIVPTRELAQQVQEEIAEIGKYKGLKSMALYGNQLMEIQRKALKAEKPQILVSTPGRLMDHLINKNIKLAGLQYLVIDEVDEILLMGFKDQLEYSLKKMPEEKISLFFSATIDEELKELAQTYLRNPGQIEIEEEEPLKKIEQLYYVVDGLKKVDLLKRIIRQEKPHKAIIFCNTREQADSLYEILNKWDRAITSLHGGMEQNQREEIMRGFRRGYFRIMVATDLASRGLHVSGITHVINYSVPFENEQYIHRIGRTGRIDERGIAISLVIPSEMERFLELEEFLGYKIPQRGDFTQERKVYREKNKKDRARFKDSINRKKAGVIRIEAGKTNSYISRRDILYTLKNVEDLQASDIGKIDIKDKITELMIKEGKEELALQALKKKGIGKKVYKVRLVK